MHVPLLLLSDQGNVSWQGRNVLPQASDAPQSDASPTKGFAEAAPVPFRPAAVSSGHAAVPLQRVEPSPKAAAQRFRPAAVPFQTAELPSAAAAEPLRPAQGPSEPAKVPSRPTAGPFRPAAVPIRPAERPTQPLVVPFQPAQVPSGSIGMPSEALEVPLNSPDAGAQTVKGPFENAQIPFKPAQLPTVTVKVSTKAAEESKQEAKQSSVVLSVEQPKQQSSVHQADQQAASSGTPAALHAADLSVAPSHCHIATEVPDQTDVRGPATGPALEPPATKAGPKAESPVAALEAKAGASTMAPAQTADLPIAPPVAKAVLKAELMSKPATSKAPVSSSPITLKSDLPDTPLAAKNASQASSGGDLDKSRQAVQQPSRSEAAPSSASLQGNSVISESAEMAAQMSVAQSPTMLGKPADNRISGQLSDKMSLTYGKQSAFPRARRPTLSAVKASVLLLQPVTTEVGQHFLVP